MPTMTRPNRASRNQRLGFTLPQQLLYRPMVEAAWNAFCQKTHTQPKDKSARRVWYEFHLEAATGKTSTTLCNRTSHFEDAMREFERLGGESIKWQMRATEGELRRARHGLQEFCLAYQVEQPYIEGIARQMFDCAALGKLNASQLRDILIALKLDLQRSL